MPVPTAPSNLACIPVGGTVTVSTGYDAAATSIVLTTGHGATLPSGTGWQLSWWNSTDYSLPTDDPNHEYILLNPTTFTVTGATNASPIVVQTSAAHTLASGDRVTISDVLGNTAANGLFTITFVDSTHFSLNGSTGNGAYTSGGTVTVSASDTITVTRGVGGTPAATHNTGGKTYKMSVRTRMGLASSCAFIQFDDNASDEDGFKVERKIGAGSFVEIARLGKHVGSSTVVNYLDKTSNASGDPTLRGALVTYRVRAYNGSGDSTYSNEDSLILSSEELPAAPTSPTATWTTTGIDVGWTHASVDAWTEGIFENPLFNVWRSESSSGPFEEVGGAQNNGTFKDRKWEFGKTYYYKVRAWHFNGIGQFSAVTSSVTTPSATTPVAAITAPSTAFVGEAFTFSGSSSTYTRDIHRWTGTAVEYSYNWDFGAGEATGYHGREGGYAYRTPGVKTITLTVYGPTGLTDVETHNITISDITVSSDTPHACTAGESGGSVSAVHRPTTFATLQAALNACVGQTDPLIELTTGATDYVGGSGAALAIPAQRTNNTWVTIRPLNYTANFTNQKRVTSSDLTNCAKINLAVSGASDSVIVTSTHATNPPKYYRFQGIQPKKSSATESSEMSDYFQFSSGSGTATVPHHFILQHCYIDGDPQTSHQRAGILANVNNFSLLDSKVINIKRPGQESYAFYGNASQGPHVLDNSELYGFSMAVFYSGEGTGLGPRDWIRHVCIRRNYLTRRAADESNTYFTTGAFASHANNWKNLYEQKRGQFIWIDSNMFGPTWMAAQPGSAVLIKAVNQSWDTNYSSSLDIQVTKNVFRNLKIASGGAGIMDIQARDTETSNNTDLVERIICAQNLAFDGVEAGATKFHFPVHLGMALGEPVRHYIQDHNTFINADESFAFNNGEWNGTAEMVADLIVTNNIHEFGYIMGQQAGALNKTALDIYAKTYTYKGNVTEGDVGGESNWSGIDATNKFPADIPTISFTNYATRDLRLSGSSPYRAAGADPATDSTDRGVNFTTLLAAVGGTSYAFGVGTTRTESGDWTDAISPATATLTLTTFAPTVTASGPLIPANATLTTTMFAPNVSVSGSRAPVIVGRTSIVGRGSVL